MEKARRRRAALACEPCRKRKIRCSRELPCNQCQRSRNRGPPCYYASNNNLPKKRTERQPPQAVTAPKSEEVFAAPSMSVSRSASASVWASSPSMETPEVDAPGRESERENDGREGSIFRPGFCAEQYAQNDFVAGGLFCKTRFYGPSHWMNTVIHSCPILVKNQIRDENDELRKMLNKTKELSQILKLLPTTFRQTINFRDFMPPRHLADELVRGYFNTYEYIYRIVPIHTFRAEYEQFWATQPDAPAYPGTSNPSKSACTLFVIRLLLMMAIGTTFYRGPLSISALRIAASHWVYAISAWLSGPFEKARINIAGVQINALFLISRQVLAINGDLGWISAGALLRTAMHIGLHHDPAYFSGMSVYHAELRRRLWATILELQVQSALDAGGPPLIHLEDFTTEIPENFDDESLTDADAKQNDRHAFPLNKKFTQSSLQIILMKSLPTRLQICHLLNNCHQNPLAYDEALRLSTEVTAHFRLNRTLLQAYDSDGGPRPSKFHTRFLDLLTYRFLLLLHEPFALMARQNPAYYFSRKAIVDTSIYLVSSSPLEPHVPPESDPLKILPASSLATQAALSSPTDFFTSDVGAEAIEDDYSRLKRLSGGIFRSVFLTAYVTIGSEILMDLQEAVTSPFSVPNVSDMFHSQASLPNGLGTNRDPATLASIHPAFSALASLTPLTSARVRSGETNVKGAFFSVGLVEQIYAKARNVPESELEQIVRGTVMNKLQQCYEWLQEWGRDSEKSVEWSWSRTLLPFAAPSAGDGVCWDQGPSGIGVPVSNKLPLGDENGRFSGSDGMQPLGSQPSFDYGVFGPGNWSCSGMRDVRMGEICAWPDSNLLRFPDIGLFDYDSAGIDMTISSPEARLRRPFA